MVDVHREALMFKLVRTPEQFARLRPIREAMYLSRMPTSNIAWAEERRHDLVRDAAGLVLVLERRDEVLATARVLAATAPEAELAAMGRMPEVRPHDPLTFEIGRIASVRSVPGRLGYGMLVAACTAIWMLGRHPGCRYVAYCKPRVARYWTQVGATQLGETFGIDGRAKAYMVIQGAAEDVRASAVSRGWLDACVVNALAAGSDAPTALPNQLLSQPLSGGGIVER